MTITVDHPVLGKVKFPDTATVDEINDTLLNLGIQTLDAGSSGEVFFNQMGEGISDTLEGVGQLLGSQDKDNYAQEFINRVQLEQSPYAGWSGLLLGSILDPVTLPAAFLKPIKFGNKLFTGAARGATAGTLGGAGAATFEEFGDDRLTNTLVGAAFGAGFGGLLSRYIARDVDNDAVAKALEDTETAVYGQAEPTALSTTRARPETQATPETAGVRPDTPFTPTMQRLNPEQQLEQELIPVAQKGVSPTTKETRDVYKNLKFAFDDATTKVKEAETNVARAGNNEARKVQATRELESAKSRLDSAKVKFDEVKAGNKAQANLDALRAGRLDALSPELTRRLNEIKVENIKSAKLQPTEQLTPAELAGVERKRASKINGQVVDVETSAPVTPRQAPEGTQRVEVAQPEQEGYAPLGTGFEGRSSAGSMGVDPSKRYAGQASEGVDESAQIQSAWSRRQVSPAEDTGAGLSEMDRIRLTMLEEAAAGRLRNLMSHQFGPYSFVDNPVKLQKAREFIAEDYDSMVDFLMDAARKNRVFNAEEQDLLEPILREAEQRVIGTFKSMRALRAKGGFKSTTLTDDEYDMVMELQFYSYVADAIKTNGTRASHSLKNLQKIKSMRRGHKSKLDKGESIDDVFGVQC